MGCYAGSLSLAELLQQFMLRALFNSLTDDRL